MEILIGIILYLIVIAFFIAFGHLMKECDTEMRNQMVGRKK